MGVKYSSIAAVLQAKLKAKETTAALVELLTTNPASLVEWKKVFLTAKDSDKGSLLSAVTEITKTQPKFIATEIELIIEQIAVKAPRVKWESSEIVANLAKQFPEQVKSAIPNLQANTTHDGTVVRWSAALALSEIAKYNQRSRVELLPFMEKTILSEESNGVKNHYVKALKFIAKEQKTK